MYNPTADKATSYVWLSEYKDDADKGLWVKRSLQNYKWRKQLIHWNILYYIPCTKCRKVARVRKDVPYNLISEIITRISVNFGAGIWPVRQNLVCEFNFDSSQCKKNI
jgi:hypothetical protein